MSFYNQGQKLKTLITRKMTVNSIVDEDSGFNGVLNETKSEIDRSLSTVIGRLQMTD
jgi:hypothetical protein